MMSLASSGEKRQYFETDQFKNIFEIYLQMCLALARVTKVESVEV